MVSSSLLGATLLTMSEAVALDDGSISEVDVLDSEQTGVSAEHRLYRCLDGWIAVAAFEPAEIENFHVTVGATPTAYFTARTQAQALADLQAAKVPADVIREAQLDPFLDDPAHAAAGLHAHYPHAVYGNLQQIGGFWDFGDLPLSLNRAPPSLGQHSREVLNALGFTDEQLQPLADAGLLKL
jgi:crotonobetainyl-CoA:carnitine CoA-transferase CaiB-like acyl-CoA transferase